MSTSALNANKLQTLFLPEEKVGKKQRTGKILRSSRANELNADAGTVFD